LLERVSHAVRPLASFWGALLPEDGFEGSVAPLLIGDAKLIDADVPPPFLPIAGKRSVFLPRTTTEARFIMRLALAPGDQFLRFTALVDLPLGTMFFPPLTATVDGRAVSPDPLYIREVPEPGRGTRHEVTMGLPPGTGGEVVVDFRYSTQQQCGHGSLGSAGVPIVLDDFLLEP
jgi:hypothetical protein